MGIFGSVRLCWVVVVGLKVDISKSGRSLLTLEAAMNRSTSEGDSPLDLLHTVSPVKGRFPCHPFKPIF